MPIPPLTLKVYEKTRVDHAIDVFARLEKPTVADLNRVRVEADIQCKINEYRFGALTMTDKQLEEEGHSSKRMACFMENSTDPRPSSHCDCHAIISGKHKLAASARAVMAWCQMRIDDPRNGFWLPRSYDDRKYMPSWLNNAVPHQGLHNPRYYDWLESRVNIDLIDGLDDLMKALKTVRTRLQAGALPPEAWPKKKV